MKTSEQLRQGSQHGNHCCVKAAPHAQQPEQELTQLQAQLNADQPGRSSRRVMDRKLAAHSR